MNSPFFSIILPIYNAREYIRQTIESILVQTFEMFEIIIVNDGSTDGTDVIVLEYAKKDSRINCFEQKNSGICSARNLAITKARGEYIMFCDHDDLYKNDALEAVYKCLQNKMYDVVKFSYTNQVIKNGTRIKSYTIGTRKHICSDRELTEDYNALNCFTYSVWNGAYNSKKLQELQITFDETIKFGMEDVTFNLLLLKQSLSICFIETAYYFHYIRYGQSTSRKFDLNKLDAICGSVELEREFLGTKVTDITKIKMMGKYIRSFFVTLGGAPRLIDCREIRRRTRRFREVIDEPIKYRELIMGVVNPDLFTDAVKVILYKLRLYRVIIFLLRGQ